MGKLGHECNQPVILTSIKLDFRPEARVSEGLLDEDPRIHATMEVGGPGRCQMTSQFLDIMQAARLPAWDAATMDRHDTHQTLLSTRFHGSQGLQSEETVIEGPLTEQGSTAKDGQHISTSTEKRDIRSRSTKSGTSIAQEEDYREESHFSEMAGSRMTRSRSPQIDKANRDNEAELADVLRGLNEYRERIAHRTQAPFHADIEAFRIRVSDHREN